MTPSERHERVTALFLAACEIAPDRRAGFLDERCAVDEELRSEVEAMLAADGTGRTIPDAPSIGADFRISWRPLETAALGGRLVPPKGAAAPAGHRPRTIADFTVIDVIGEGGMGIVYLAEQRRPKRRVALKLLKPMSTSADGLRRFEHESQTLALLQHPGIAQVYQAGLADGGSGSQPFFAMEYVEGAPLTTHAADHELSVRARLELLHGVCDAVHHAHQKGVIHCDLKPANVLVDPAGQPKVLDFGVARVIDVDVRATTMRTERGQLLGTVPYMSPEQACGRVAEIDVRSDVYALGVVAYELLAGRLPHDLDDLMLHEAVRVVQETEPPPLGAIDRGLRGDVETIVAKALEKDPERRYQSASDLGADISRFLACEPIIARPASSMYQLRRFAQRHRAIVAGGLVAALALLVGLAGTTWQAVVAEGERDRAVEAEAQAERRFEQARSLANAFIFDIYDEIETVPGTTSARRSLIATALDYLDGLAVEESGDETLRHDLAAGYLKIGHVLGNPGDANLGDQRAALESYEKALAIRESMLTRAPADHEARLDVAYVLRKTGHVLAVTGETEEALSRHERAVALARDVLATEVDHRRARSEVASNRRTMGRLAHKLGDMDRAFAWGQEAVAIDEELVADVGDDPARLDALRGSYYTLADMLESVGQTEASLEMYGRAHELARRVCELRPGSTRYRRGLFSSHLMLGDLLKNTGRMDEAVEHFEAGLEIAQALAWADPRDLRARQDIGYATERIAYFHLERGRKELALETFETGLEARAAVVEASPDDTEASYNLAISMVQAGEALLALDRADEARVKFEHALARVESLHERDPVDSWTQWLLAGVLENVGKALEALGRHDDALLTYERMRDVAATVVDHAPESIANLTMLAQALKNLGITHARLGHTEVAVAHHEQSLRMWDDIAVRDPASLPATVHVAAGRESLGRLLRDLSELDAAIDSLQVSVRLRESVLGIEPESERRRSEYAAALVELAATHRARADAATATPSRGGDDLRMAIELLERADEVLEPLVSEEMTTRLLADLAACRESLAAIETRSGE